MQIEKLTKSDKILLKSTYKQNVQFFVLVGLLIGLIVLSMHYVVNRIDLTAIPIPKDTILGVSTVLFTLAYLGFYYYSIRPHLLDIDKKEKYVKMELLVDKIDKTIYGYSMGTMTNSKKNLTMIEYYLKFQDFELKVEQKDYEKFNNGDIIKISITSYTKQIIQLEKN